MNEYITMDKLNTGETAVAVSIDGYRETVHRLADMGLVENAVVKCVGKSPLGDPAAYLISGAVIAIRSSDSYAIKVRRRNNG